jgi:spore coat protein A, manganese oxidase
MPTRRQLLKTGTVSGAALLVPAAYLTRPAYADPVPGGTLDPKTVPKYVTALHIPPVMPRVSGTVGVDRYEIAGRQVSQRVLPSGFPATTVFAYGPLGAPGGFHWPSATIEARVGRTVRVRWANQLMTASGRFLPHLFPVDPTLHWANPPGGVKGRDSRPDFTKTPGPYRGPVPFVTHLHGAHVTEDSDGYPEAWYLPPARDIPRGYAKVGSFYERFKAEAEHRSHVNWTPGSAVFDYPDDQRATALWYHTHDLGLTRLNIYAGFVGMYLLRGGPSDLPPGVLPGRPYEIPLVVQDRSFNTDGSLFFPASRGFFGDVPPGGPFIPKTDVSPMWNPEFFGNTMVVNGNTWPVLEVEPRRYRFRLLNACNARTVFLKVTTDPLAPRPTKAALPIWVIGSDGGFVPAPVAVESIRLGVAERYDVIVDFTKVPPGTALYLVNEGPDEPFGEPGFEPADPGTTGQVMKFVVTRLRGPDRTVPPAQLHLPPVPRLGNASRTRQLSLNELDSTTFDGAPIFSQLGLIAADGSPQPLPWHADVTENPKLGATEIWELRNFTEDGHPIHVHQVQFEVLDRRPFGGPDNPTQIGDPVPPEAFEHGPKDTLIAPPGMITRLKAHFDIPGRFVWHCHIIDHEDNEMMRPYQVG